MLVRIDNLRVGQVWDYNRAGYEGWTIHVLAIFVDMRGKYRIAIQHETRKKTGIRAHYMNTKLVSPQYFYGMTLRVST